ncbi:hypothetical protein [Falsiroseomonas sp.]|uniref:hypothetical protein n=1 Tax=Falsiroseomonas sp. TaxID=2870721 RepID=UPI0027185BE4|nr:hypothetical protein [Falsiroseomonas sp.]MDO9499362.1 hypothetical protein [Falsiroseomonas sp.]
MTPHPTLSGLPNRIPQLGTGTQAVWPDRAARFYAASLDRSDYGAAIAGVLRGEAPASLLDIGAGAGHPVLPWLPAGSGWTALEPNRYLRARLGRLRRTGWPGLRPLDARWESLPGLVLAPHDWAFAANIGATLTAPRALLGHMRALARRRVVWVVPAQQGPRRWCLAGALPADLHGEDETPALRQVLAALGPEAPQDIRLAPWTFRAHFPDLHAALAHCAAQLALPPGGPARDRLAATLAATAEPLPCGGVALTAPKLSALLIWNM